MNDKNIKILIRFLLFFSVLGLICLYGITHTYALETKTIYSSNSSGTLSNSNKYTYGFINQGGVQTTASASVNTTINGRALALIYYMYEPVQLNHTYTMVVNFMGNDLYTTFNSNMVQVATCNGEVCNDNAIVSVTKNNPTGMSNKLTIQFNPVTSGSILLVNLSDKTTARLITGTYENQTFGIKSVTLDNVNANQDIINNQTNNTNNIINNNNSNTQDIINNQNQNTQQQIESQQVCEHIDKSNIENDNKLIGDNGILYNNENYGVTNYINIISSKIKVLQTFNTSSLMCFYNTNKEIISCITESTLTLNQLITIPNNSTYVRFSINKSQNKPQFEICKNGNQALNDSIDEQTNAINDLNDSINSTDYDISGLDNVVGWLPPGPVDSILNLPLNLFNAYTTALGLTCSPLNIPLPYINKNLPIPCLRSIFDEIGVSTWWEGFGYLAAAIILYNYLLSLYNWVDKTLTLRENTMPGYYDDKFGGGA